ncbi:hypothetical protein EZV62_022897 [Acer yangbiense]|uniref:NAC domain-containing protein n=1 Tax=Acer yangbiense TaxID=1000413 RepID=A0A5C7H0C7_9ROSI|nr:hypothetical protein EZV62_022897 [Acer yangbiense]
MMVIDGVLKRLIGFKKTLVFYKGSNTRKENRTNWIMHEYHEYRRNKDLLLQGKVVVCRIERKQNKKHVPSSDLDEGQASDNLAYDSGNNVVPELVTQLLQYNHVACNSLMEKGSQLLPNQYLPSKKDIFSEVEPLVPAEWDDALIGYYELQYSPISSVDSIVWNTPLESEQEDDFGNLKWDIQDVFFGEETGHSLPLDVNSPKTVTEAHIRNGCDEIAICVNYCYIS